MEMTGGKSSMRQDGVRGLSQTGMPITFRVTALNGDLLQEGEFGAFFVGSLLLCSLK